MSTVMSFDSWEEAEQMMAKAEDSANEALLAPQIAIRDDTTHTRHWCRAFPEGGFVIFGEAPTLEALAAKEATYYDMTDPEEKGEFDYMVTQLAPRRARGYLTGTAYSIVEPDGEYGDTHVANVIPISEEAFEEARACGWRVVVADDLVLASVSVEDLRGRATPTLVNEIQAFQAEYVQEG